MSIRSKSVTCLQASIFAMLALINTTSAQTSVEVIEVQQGNSFSSLQLSGNIVATRSVSLGSEVAAQVANVHCEVGDVVEKGTLLIELNDQPARLELAIKQAELNESKASAKLAKLEEQRLQKLLLNGSVSAESYDQAFTRLQQANATVNAQEAEVALLRDVISRHRLTATFAGVVTERPVEQGSWARLGDTLVELSSLDFLRMQVSVPQRYYTSLSADAVDPEAHITLSEFQQPVSVPVERIVPFTDLQRNFQLWLALDNKERRWLPGMSAIATLRWQSSLDTGLRVTRDTLVRKANGQINVWKAVADDQSEQWQVTPVTVTVDPSPGMGNHVIIWATNSEETLLPGDKLVSRGNESLRPGQKVKPILLREANAK